MFVAEKMADYLEEQHDWNIRLYNAHNGYYSHGFTMSINEKETRSGYL